MTNQTELQEAVSSLKLHLNFQCESELRLILTALADAQKELEELRNHHNVFVTGDKDLTAFAEALAKERDLANERLAKVEKELLVYTNPASQSNQSS